MNRDLWSERIATWFGCGHSPIAPGTVGSIAAIPLHLALRRLSSTQHWLAIGAVTAAGFWSANATAERLGDEDPSQVVIDEVAGTLIAMALVSPLGMKTRLVAMVLFRVLDITKPGIIDKVQDMKPPGVGIMVDDILAGLAAGLATRWLRLR